MSDIKFVNNIGELLFQRCLISVSDQWTWNGRNAHKVKNISIDGYMNRDEIERVSEILTDSTQSAKERGNLGQLMLPWTTLENIQVQDVSQGVGTWIDLQQIQANFVDEFPDSNAYTIHFLDFELHNPRIAIGLPQGELKDEYPQMSLQFNTLWDAHTVGAGVMRTKTAAGMIEMSLSGTFVVEDAVLPENWLTRLVRRSGMSPDTISFNHPGWPMPFDMETASPELGKTLKYRQIILTGAKISWDVEAGVGQLDVEMFCQPQRLV